MDVSGQCVGPVKMGLTRPEMLANNYHTTPRNIPEEHRSHNFLCLYSTTHNISKVYTYLQYLQKFVLSQHGNKQLLN
jgi:hypothetical protein